MALACGILFASPVIFLQAWRFVAPGLYRHEKRVLFPFAAVSSLCFLGGAAFGYFVVFPPAFRFFLGYASNILDPLPGVSEYFSLALQLLISFGVIFELPVFMVFLAKAGVVDTKFLRRNRKYALLISFIVAAVVTPTSDVVNQLLMAGPLVILYEISVVAVAVFGRHRFSGFVHDEDEDEGEAREPDTEDDAVDE